MAERPILFDTEMVGAILDDRKRKTRRLVREIPLHEPYFTVDEGIAFACDADGKWHTAEAFSRIQPDDVLWVRETWAHTRRGYEYRADCPDPNKFRDGSIAVWRPSIHMPRNAARLFLRVTDVQIERLRDITEQDAIEEGFEESPVVGAGTNINFMCSVDCLQGSARGRFAQFWDRKIKPDDMPRYGWKANPWVWTIGFDRII